MNRILIVAHPDDEILWFNPSFFEKIYIVFCWRHDKEKFSIQRKEALRNHPFSRKIDLLDFDEPGYWKDRTRHQFFEKTKEKFLKWLHQLRVESPSEIYTHNEVGEYGHCDHTLVSECIRKVFSGICPIWMPTIGLKNYQPSQLLERQEEIDLKQFSKIRDIYLRYGVWTWNLDFFPKNFETYYTKYIAKG